MTKTTLLGWVIYGLATLLGVAAFMYPFFAFIPQEAGLVQMRATDAPLFLSLLVGICLIAILFEAQSAVLGAKFMALLGVLVAINSVLRFAENAIPGPAGFSPIFFLITLTGYTLGGRVGFLLGALTLIVSALITGGVGPWLPFQMFAAGWVGLTAPACRFPVRWLRAEGKWPEVLVLAVFGGLWGILYGVIINVSFWPYVAGPMEQRWQPGTGLWEGAKRYLGFYLATSFLWDSARLAGNLVMTWILGAPTLRVLRRFRKRLLFTYHPIPEDLLGAQP